MKRRYLAGDQVCRGNLILVNKKHPLQSPEPADRVIFPGSGEELKAEAEQALERLVKAAEGEGELLLQSGYRTEEGALCGFTGGERPGVYGEIRGGAGVQRASDRAGCGYDGKGCSGGSDLPGIFRRECCTLQEEGGGIRFYRKISCRKGAGDRNRR